ncbi:MAG: uncharacterized protein A8A55_1867 [Amphiamblys sp. WSBS2006]|nr:MAG: uncharacterized protein A8A55_1867 [Amphiamblys sp. WSBS2006]
MFPHRGNRFLERPEGVFIIPETDTKNECMRSQVKWDRIYPGGEHKKTILEYRSPDWFWLALQNEATLLTEKTTVQLSNIAISEELLFVLIRKTNVRVGEEFSIFEHAVNGDCIKDTPRDGVGKPSKYTLSLDGDGENETVSSRTLENIRRIPQNSIECCFREVVIKNTVLISIVPKLKLREGSVLEEIRLAANERKYIEPTQEQMFCVGRIKRIVLIDYAVDILPRLEIQKDNVLEELVLDAKKDEHVAQEQRICVRRIKKIVLVDCAVNILLRLEIQKGSVLEELVLAAKKDEHVAQEQRICVKRIKKIVLIDYAVAVVLRLEIQEGSVLEELTLTAKKEEHAVLAQEQVVCVRRIKKITLRDYAVAVIFNLGLQEDGELEELTLAAWLSQIVAPILAQKRMLCIGRIKKIVLKDHAINILPNLNIRKHGELRWLELHAMGIENFAHLLNVGDRSIDVWDVKTAVYGRHQHEILSKLNGTNTKMFS